MLRYFWGGLKPSILAELEYQDLELESFNQMVKKAVNDEAKSALWPRSSTKEIDQNCPRGNRPAHSTVSKSQDSAMKDPQVEEPKIRGAELLPGPQRSNNNELSHKAWKEKKKKQRRRDRERQKGSTPATGVNAAHTSEPHQNKKNQGRLDRASHDTNQIKCYNCQKLDHYANKSPEPID